MTDYIQTLTEDVSVTERITPYDRPIPTYVRELIENIPLSTGVLDRQVDSGQDDVRCWRNNGAHTGWSKSSYDGTIGYFFSSLQKAGVAFRFRNITIPQGMTIVSAKLIVLTSTGSQGTFLSYFRAHDADDSNPIDTDTDLHARPLTTAQVAWDTPGVLVQGWHDTPDIATVIQEVVDRDGWAAGNSLNIYWDDFDGRSTGLLEHVQIGMWDHLGGVVAAKLHIEYGNVAADSIATAKTWVREFGEVLSPLSDTFATVKSQSRTLLETITPGDKALYPLWATLTETVHLVDVMEAHIVQYLTLTEGVTATDTIIKNASLIRLEAIDTVDAIIKNAYMLLSEAATLGDTLSRGFHLVVLEALTETITLSDVVIKNASKLLSERFEHGSGSPRLSDMVGKATTPAPLTEGVAAGDTITKDTSRTITESVTATDTILKVMRVIKSEAIDLIQRILGVPLDVLRLFGKFRQPLTITASFRQHQEITSTIGRGVLEAQVDVVVRRRVAASADDGYVHGATFYPSLNTLGVGDHPAGAMHIWARFIDIQVPRRAKIVKAYLDYIAASSLAVTAVNTKIRAEAADDATVIVDKAAFDAATKTTAEAAWDGIPAFTAEGFYRSPDIGHVIQEVVNRIGYERGNAIGIFHENDGSDADAYRDAHSYDGSATKAPLLHIEYEGGDG